jgi:hypothetical protein
MGRNLFDKIGLAVRIGMKDLVMLGIKKLSTPE